MDPQKLYDERKKVVDGIRSLLEAAGDNPLGAEDREKHEKMEARYDELTAQIKDADAQRMREEEEKRLDRRATPVVEPARAGGASEPVVNTTYRDAFMQYVRSGHKSAALETRATTDPQSLTSADGGYTVPNEWYNQFIQSRKDANIMRGLATVIQSNSGTMNLAVQSTEGVAAWYSESDSIVVAKETYTYKTFSAYKAGRIIKVTSELLHDGMFDTAAYLMSQLARSIGVLEEAAFLVGTGTTHPTGIFSGATTGVTAASGTAVTADELIDLYHSVGQAYRRDASWIMADGTVKLIRKLKDGNGQYLWQPGLQAGQPDRIFGRAVYTSSNAPAATTGLDAILFGWIGGYYIVDRVGLQMMRLDELYAVNDQIGFRGTARTDGGLVDTSAVRVLTMG